MTKGFSNLKRLLTFDKGFKGSNSVLYMKQILIISTMGLQQNLRRSLSKMSSL